MKKLNKQQSGMILMISLIILLLLTIIAITAIKVTSQEERMASNLQNHNVAFQAAESALREAEVFIQGQTTVANSEFNPLKLVNGPFQNTTTPKCVNGLCGTTTPLQSTLFSDSTTGKKVAATDIATISREPDYIIEFIDVEYVGGLGEEYRSAMFRITARAWGGDSTTRVQLESTFRAIVKIVQ